MLCSLVFYLIFFFFNSTPTTAIYTLSLHDALPISHAQRHLRVAGGSRRARGRDSGPADLRPAGRLRRGDRKSTRLNSSHITISYAVFCLKKKKTIKKVKVPRYRCDAISTITIQ